METAWLRKLMAGCWQETLSSYTGRACDASFNRGAFVAPWFLGIAGALGRCYFPRASIPLGLSLPGRDLPKNESRTRYGCR